MAKKISPLLPLADELLQQFGERLRLARLRRGLSAKQVCERAGMAPMTLRSLERGASGVTIGAYLAVMQVLGIEQDLKLLGQVDTMGRSLQDARLPAPRMAAKRPNVQRKASPRNDANEPIADGGNTANERSKEHRPDYVEMARSATGGNANDQIRKALETNSAEMDRIAAGSNAVDELRSGVIPDYAEMVRLATGGNAVDELRKALESNSAEMDRWAAGGGTAEAIRKASEADRAEMLRLTAGNSAVDELRKALETNHTEMLHLAAGVNAADDMRKALETDHAEMLRLAAGSNTADDMRKAQEVGIAKNLPTDWASDGEFISSSELSHLLTPSKKEK